MSLLLAGDIGGTKTNLAIYEPKEGPYQPLASRTFPSGRYKSLEAIVADFLATVDYSIEQACFGVAGPVMGRQATVTNLPWIIDVDQMEDAFSLKAVHLLNDLQAIASAVPSLAVDDLYVLKPGRAIPGGSIAVIAPGTGLGEAYLCWDGAAYRPYACEGGHADFAPTNETEMALLSYLWRVKGLQHVSYESVCSGIGIPNLYAFFRDRDAAPEPAWLAEQVAKASDPTPVIAEAATGDRPVQLAQLTMQTFVSILGAEVGNMALNLLATGGVYLGGGIPPRILPLLSDGRFLTAFRTKGRLARVLTDMPIYVILNAHSALFGAACYGLGQMRRL